MRLIGLILAGVSLQSVGEIVQRTQSRRDELLEQVAEHIRSNGLADLSLRSIARALGLSAPALLYHFDSKEALLAEALELLQSADLSHLDQAASAGGSLSDSLTALWRAQSSEEAERAQLALMEVDSIAAKNPSRFPRYRARIHQPTLEAFESMLTTASCPPETRRSNATLLAAVYRGLLTDTLQTGERGRTDAALRALCQLLDQLQDQPGSEPQESRPQPVS